MYSSSRRLLMNLLVAYARIPMSFLNLYRQRRPQGTYTVAIGCIMFGILVINLWSLILVISLFDRGWLADGPRMDPTEFGGLCVGVLLTEIIFVGFVQHKTARDSTFADRVRNSRPTISICYTVVSVALLAVSAILAI